MSHCYDLSPVQTDAPTRRCLCREENGHGGAHTCSCGARWYTPILQEVREVQRAFAF